MSTLADHGYLIARAADELANAAVARSEAARAAHARLAQLYAEKARASGIHPDIVLDLDRRLAAVPELDMGRGSREQGFGQRGCR